MYSITEGRSPIAIELGDASPGDEMGRISYSGVVMLEYLIKLEFDAIALGQPVDIILGV
jgi:hypothetical protein